MAEVVYIASPESANGRNLVADGVLRALASVHRTGLFRPVISPTPITRVLLDDANAEQGGTGIFGVTARCVREEPNSARADIVAAFHHSLQSCDAEAMVVVGTDATASFNPERFKFDALVAADLQAPMLLAVCTLHRTPEDLKESIESCINVANETGSTVVGIVVTGCTPAKENATSNALKDLEIPHWSVPPTDFPPADSNQRDIEQTRHLFDSQVPRQELIDACHAETPKAVTAYAFQHGLLDRAKYNKQTIVLPEGDEPRMLQAADYLLERDIVNLTILADQATALKQAHELGLKHLSKAHFQSIDDPALLETAAKELHHLRASKGMTMEQAREQLTNPTYFGTMLVHLGYADGLVSGSRESTANTVRPALQVIKSKPGTTLVSSTFFMCFNNQVSLFADCAINLHPTAEELAQIALQTTQTARAFGIDPKVGMLSYSTLGSGKGPDTELVEKATELLRKMAPELPVVGPIQFDAALSPTVAAVKAPGNPVAGQVNVFIFPNLTAGNIGYKAVQHTAGALAVGPVLQGLRKPVNDLSRGASVQDIINTIALTAVEAQHS